MQKQTLAKRLAQLIRSLVNPKASVRNRLAQLVRDLKTLNTIREGDDIVLNFEELTFCYFANIEIHLTTERKSTSDYERDEQIIKIALEKEFGINNVVIRKRIANKIPKEYAVYCCIEWEDGVDS